MFKNLVDVLKEVFWLKKSPPQGRVSSRRSKTAVKKKTIKSLSKPVQKRILKRANVKVSRPAAKTAVKGGAEPKKAAKSRAAVLDPALVRVGEITHYFERIKVCVVKVTKGSILIGDRLTIAAKGSTFVQKVWSMQIESQDVKVAKKGQLIGLKVDKPVAVGNHVYK